ASHHYQIVDPHQPNKNWQLNSVFAEDGKHKEVMVYADGSLRSRQTVTRNNDLDIPIVGETIYDPVGRPVVEVLPVPMIKDQGCPTYDNETWAPITYYPGFNLAGATAPEEDPHSYHYTDLIPGDGCGAGASPMIPDNGAELYYSPAQLLLSGSL